MVSSIFYQQCIMVAQYLVRWSTLTFSHVMLKNGQAYFKYLAVFTLQDFQSMFGNF